MRRVAATVVLMGLLMLGTALPASAEECDEAVQGTVNGTAVGDTVCPQTIEPTEPEPQPQPEPSTQPSAQPRPRPNQPPATSTPQSEPPAAIAPVFIEPTTLPPPFTDEELQQKLLDQIRNSPTYNQPFQPAERYQAFGGTHTPLATIPTGSSTPYLMRIGVLLSLAAMGSLWLIRARIPAWMVGIGDTRH